MRSSLSSTSSSTVFVFSLILSASAVGPVRNLQCYYNTAEFDALSCKWKEPENSNGPIQYYKVKITHNGGTIFEGNTSSPFISLNYYLKPDDIYVVHVTPVTDGPSVSASFDLV